MGHLRDWRWCEMWPVSTCVVPGVCSIGWGAGSISQRRGMGSQTSRAAAQTQSKTACTWFMLHWNKQSSLIWLFFALDFRKWQHWKKLRPVRWRSQRRVQTPTTKTSTATWLAPLLQRMRRTRWRPTGRMAVVSADEHRAVSLTAAGLAVSSCWFDLPIDSSPSAGGQQTGHSVHRGGHEWNPGKEATEAGGWHSGARQQFLILHLFFVYVCLWVCMLPKYCLIHPEMQYMYSTKGLVLMTVVNTYMLTILLLMYWWSGSYVCLNWKTGTLSLIFCHF